MKVLSPITSTSKLVTIDFCTTPNPNHWWMTIQLESITIPQVGTFKNLQAIEHVEGSIYHCTFDHAEINNRFSLTSTN